MVEEHGRQSGHCGILAAMPPSGKEWFFNDSKGKSCFLPFPTEIQSQYHSGKNIYLIKSTLIVANGGN
jgi:hypothetical protein